MKIKIALLGLSALLLAACDTAPTTMATLVPADNAAYKEKGTATIKGCAYGRDPEGKFTFKADCLVLLLPNTPYFRDWVKASEDAETDPTPLKMDDAASPYIRRAVTDDKGNYVFSNLPAGSYIAIARFTVITDATSGILGAARMAVHTAKVTVAAGQTQENEDLD